MNTRVRNYKKFLKHSYCNCEECKQKEMFKINEFINRNCEIDEEEYNEQ